MSLNKLLFHHYIDPHSGNANLTTILALVNELRIISRKQIKQFITTNKKLNKKTYDKLLNTLEELHFIERMYDYTYQRSTVYYITREGIAFLGSSLTAPNNPKYNVEHHLKINDMMLEAIQVLGYHPLLNSISSERRLVHEQKDAKENTKGRIYKVPDFCFEFLDPEADVDINWHFEIELTLKSVTRYQERILPHYMNLLDNEFTKDEKIIYAVPTEAIQRKLYQMVGEIEHKKNRGYANLIIVHFDDFATTLLELSQDLRQTKTQRKEEEE
ncbi:replication-relaxation family protein [Listeria sp. ILCC797]|uniref:replication-relaxation family protein n=1 Tax=Listeria sp. ILCC797 TaxID=1918333 RepID=UPI000B58FB9D|nr:replication-relaxation family protein [Listeria sp. ILCC797]